MLELCMNIPPMVSNYLFFTQFPRKDRRTRKIRNLARTRNRFISRISPRLRQTMTLISLYGSHKSITSCEFTFIVSFVSFRSFSTHRWESTKDKLGDCSITRESCPNKKKKWDWLKNKTKIKENKRDNLADPLFMKRSYVRLHERSCSISVTNSSALVINNSHGHRLAKKRNQCRLIERSL